MKATGIIKKRVILSITLLLCVLTAWFAFSIHDKVEKEQIPVYPLSRHVQYSFTLRNRSSYLQENIKFNVRAPVKQTASQLCVKLDSSHAYELITDNAGNRIMRYTFDRLPPYSTRIVKIGVSMKFSPTPNRLPETSMKIYLEPQPYCESQHREIRQLAATLRKEKEEDTAADIYGWVCAHVKYAGYLKHPRGALYALRKGRGDCTEFMYLFAALCRANGIPARCIGGYVCKKDTILHPGGYHNWAEFYLHGRWWVADPQNRVFKKLGDRYLALKIIVPDVPENRFEIFSSNLKDMDIKMN